MATALKNLDRDGLKKVIAAEGLGKLADLGINTKTSDADIRKIIAKARKEKTAGAEPEPEPEAGSGSTPAAARAPRTNAKVQKIKAEVEAIAKRLAGGGKMKAEKEKYSVSDDGPIRIALYHAGYDSKGKPLPEERKAPITGTPKQVATKLVKERQAARPLYELAARSGKTENEVKAIIAEAGGPTARVYGSGGNGGR